MESVPTEDLLFAQGLNPPGIGSSSSRTKPQSAVRGSRLGRVAPLKSEWRPVSKMTWSRYRDDGVEVVGSAVATNTMVAVGLVLGMAALLYFGGSF